MATRKILFLPRTSLAKEILSDRAKAILESLGGVVWSTMDRDYMSAELAELLSGAGAAVTSWGSQVFQPELLPIAGNLRIVGHAAGTVKRLMPAEGYDRGIVVLGMVRYLSTLLKAGY